MRPRRDRRVSRREARFGGLETFTTGCSRLRHAAALSFSCAEAEVAILARAPGNLQCGPTPDLGSGSVGGRSEAPNPERLARPLQSRRAPAAAAPASAAEKAQLAVGPARTGPSSFGRRFSRSAAGPGRQGKVARPRGAVGPPGLTAQLAAKLSLPAPAGRANVHKPRRLEAPSGPGTRRVQRPSPGGKVL